MWIGDLNPEIIFTTGLSHVMRTKFSKPLTVIQYTLVSGEV